MGNRHRLEEGQDIVEYALILPFLLLLTLSIIDGGWLIFRYNTIANAAREGARAGIIPACDKDCIEGKAKAAAQEFSVGLVPPLTDDDVVVSSTAMTLSVTVNYDAQLITGSMIQVLGETGMIPLSATATMQRE